MSVSATQGGHNQEITMQLGCHTIVTEQGDSTWSQTATCVNQETMQDKRVLTTSHSGNWPINQTVPLPMT